MMRKDNEELTHFALSISLIHQDNRDFGDNKRRDVTRESLSECQENVRLYRYERRKMFNVEPCLDNY